MAKLNNIEKIQPCLQEAISTSQTYFTKVGFVCASRICVDRAMMAALLDVDF